jgi:hypothetical protein
LNRQSDYQRFFQKPETVIATDLLEEIQSRKEAAEFSLSKCPCCQSEARAFFGIGHKPTIICSKHGCKVVDGATWADAAEIWNETRFSEAK